MKKIGTWLFAIFFGLGLIGFIFGGEDENKENNTKTENVKVKKHIRYIDLPIKEDLSYFATNKNIAKQILTSIENSPLSNYEKGLELGGKIDVIEEKINKAFYIDANLVIVGNVTAQIDNSQFNEFEIDDFRKKLKEEFSQSLKNLRYEYTLKDRHIRIVNLNIPISYSKLEQDKAKVALRDKNLIDQLSYKLPLTPIDFINDTLSSDFISKYLISDFKANTELKVNFGLSNALEIRSQPDILNNIGKNNKGSDFITELTLHSFNPKISYNGITVNFMITSFKLKSSDKRFIVNMYLEDIDKLSGPRDYYMIANDDQKIIINKE